MLKDNSLYDSNMNTHAIFYGKENQIPMKQPPSFNFESIQKDYGMNNNNKKFPINKFSD